MSNVVTTGARLPTISRDLNDAITARGSETRFGPSESAEERNARMRRGDPAPGMVIRIHPDRPSTRVIAEAQSILPALEAAMRPANARVVLEAAERMLISLNGAVANPFSVDAARARACLLADVAQDLPSGVWDQSTDRALLRACKFMPSVAEMVELLEAQVQPLRDKIAKVRMIAASGPDRTEDREPLTPEEIERRRKILADRKAELEAQTREEDRIRKHGNHTPAGAEGLTGLDLANALKRALPAMSGDLREVTERRIAMLEQNAALIAQLGGEKPTENSEKEGARACTETAVLA